MVYFFVFLQHNTQMLKGLFKKLDPSVMKPIGDIKGEIHLSFKYDAGYDQLLIKVIECRDLANRDIRGKMSNFYVKVCLQEQLSARLQYHSSVCYCASEIFPNFCFFFR